MVLFWVCGLFPHGGGTRTWSKTLYKLAFPNSILSANSPFRMTEWIHVIVYMNEPLIQRWSTIQEIIKRQGWLVILMIIPGEKLTTAQ